LVRAGWAGGPRRAAARRYLPRDDRMTDTRPAVRLDKVTRRFGDVVAVDSVSFEVARGELVTLLGPSGCGKTTMLRLVAGLELASEGRIEIAGRDVTALSASQRDVAMVFQSYALFPHMSVFDNVAYGLRMTGLPKAEIRERAEATLDTVGLKGLGGRMPAELSGGQQQRVAVARAVVLEPDVLLFDEPLSNLDAKLRRRVRDDIRELQQRLGLTAVYVTHDQEEALAISDRVVVMESGRILQAGSPRELYERPDSRFVADFIGDANLLDAEITGVSDGMATVRLGGMELALPARGLPPGPATVAVRPHAVRISAPEASDPLTGTVIHAAYLGARIELELETAIGRIFAVSPPSAEPPATGAIVAVGFEMANVTLIGQS